ncbi:argininosuccinate synthase [Zopfia rhizophila CBS 207.26]|uniref:argininosuccinate synthase n=1 Tax=Zopfia rhizophila CBS 207.26 TaxID=1314779 RepID=A0A6A6EPT0_9PEZI|nr:argininosuccinate synthase [Zopfia rhizophila CBS 207.26]
MNITKLTHLGGLDTSTTLRWLIDYEVNALKFGAIKMVILDLRREFVEELCFRAQENCQFVSHGCPGKGNDQLRFELAFYTLQPSIKVIAPWRLPEFCDRFKGRQDLHTKAKPWNMDANLAHCSYEAGILEDPDQSPSDDMWSMADSPLNAPNDPTDITIHFEEGILVKVVTPEKTYTDSVELIDIVENRFIGLKSRGCYDSPAMTILRLAHLDLEGLVMDAQVRSLRDQFSVFIENSLLFSQRRVNGDVRLKLQTEKLYSEEEASMDTLDSFSPMDTARFIAIQSIRLKKYGLQKAKDGSNMSHA